MDVNPMVDLCSAFSVDALEEDARELQFGMEQLAVAREDCDDAWVDRWEDSLRNTGLQLAVAFMWVDASW